MKKLVSVILATILVAGAMVTVGAYDSYPVQEELVYQFEDKFVERFSATYDQIENLYVYDELYYHYDENGQIDWSLISAKPNTDFETADIKYLKFNDFVLHSNSTRSFFFEMQYGIYDVDADAFMSIVDCYYKLDKYEEAVDALREVPHSRPIGDYDDDNRLSILDATGIQRMLAKLDDLRYDGYHDKFGNMGDFADFDGDGEVSILDATAIQRKLAQLDDEPLPEPGVQVNNDLVLVEYSYDGPIVTPDPVSIEFEEKLSEQQSYGMHSAEFNEFAAIIKSKEQYDSLFRVYQDEFTEDFFEDKWLLASVCIVTDYYMVADITDIGVMDNTLYISINKYLSGSDGMGYPIAPPYYNFVAVDKDDVAYVTDIVWE